MTRRSAPAAGRNMAPILSVLASEAPERGRALELASGTGQHVAALARALPGLDWQPSDLDPGNMASIAAWAEAPNIRPPLVLDACAPGWAARLGRFELVLVVNLLHLVPAPAAETLLAEAALALAPGGLLAVYGPFLREGRTTSEGDAAFDTRLRAEIPGAGYKDLAWVRARMAAASVREVAMPANNLFLLARAP